MLETRNQKPRNQKPGSPESGNPLMSPFYALHNAAAFDSESVASTFYSQQVRWKTPRPTPLAAQNVRIAAEPKSREATGHGCIGRAANTTSETFPGGGNIGVMDKTDAHDGQADVAAGRDWPPPRFYSAGCNPEHRCILQTDRREEEGQQQKSTVKANKSDKLNRSSKKIGESIPSFLVIFF
jgi:hypothetical protein